MTLKQDQCPHCQQVIEEWPRAYMTKQVIEEVCGCLPGEGRLKPSKPGQGDLGYDSAQSRGPFSQDK